MANDVKVVIELFKTAPKVGFGMPLIFAGTQDKAVAYTEVSELADVLYAGFTEDSNVYAAAQLLFMQDNAPNKIAVCASTEATVSALPGILEEGWRQLVVVSDDSTVEAISDYIEACGKHAVYFARVEPTADASVIEAVTGNERTVLLAYEGVDVANPEAALVGATAGMDAGSFTYKNIILKGVAAQTYTDYEVKNMHKSGVITVLKKAGDIVTSEGIVVSGEYVDIVDSKDYIIEQIEYQCQKLMNRVPKLHYDNRGISQLESVVVSVLKEAADNGMIAQNDDGNGYMYSVNFRPRSECDAADISARNYNGGSFEFTLAGAIHNATIKGQIIA